MSDLAALSVADLSGLLESGEVSPVELTEAVLANVSRYDDTLKAYIDVYAGTAMAAARDAETEIAAGRYRGPLHGVPMGIKDNIYIAGRVTTMGSRIHRDFVADTSATVVDRLASAGAVLVGKHNLHEYALGGTTDNPFYGTCRNPWDLTVSPGGSSGGCAAALASDMTVGALGTDTSGSIRVPAALCGVVGLKPTYGLVSTAGSFPEAPSLDHVGPMTRTVQDAAIVLDAISERPTRTADRLAADLDGVVVGVDEEFFFTDVDDDIARCVRDGIAALCGRGATVRSLRTPGLSRCGWAVDVIDLAEAQRVHRRSLRGRPHDFGDDVHTLLSREEPSVGEREEAARIRRELRSEVERAFAEVDVLVGPTCPVRAPSIGAVDTGGLFRLVEPASLLGLPSLSVPCGVASGLPVGMQVIGPALGEQRVLDVGHALELTEPMGPARATAYQEGLPAFGG